MFDHVRPPTAEAEAPSPKARGGASAGGRGISEQRAESVRQCLVSRGVPAARVTILGYAAAWARHAPAAIEERNRRAQLRLVRT